MMCAKSNHMFISYNSLRRPRFPRKNAASSLFQQPHEHGFQASVDFFPAWWLSSTYLYSIYSYTVGQ